MPSKAQETLCKDEFSRWLTSHQASSQIWEDEDHDPPDFWLILDGLKYAVEVTRIERGADRTDTFALWRLVGEVEKQAREAGDLAGTYVVEIYDRIERMGKNRRPIVEALRRYVRDTASAENAEAESIMVDGELVGRISKYHSRGQAIHPAGGPPGKGISSEDIRAELTQLLQGSLTAKSKIPQDIHRPSILILHDLYRLADRDMFVQCVLGIPEAKLFDTIYVVEDQGVGYVVHSGLQAGRCNLREYPHPCPPRRRGRPGARSGSARPRFLRRSD